MTSTAAMAALPVFTPCSGEATEAVALGAVRAAAGAFRSPYPDAAAATCVVLCVAVRQVCGAGPDRAVSATRRRVLLAALATFRVFAGIESRLAARCDQRLVRSGASSTVVRWAPAAPTQRPSPLPRTGRISPVPLPPSVPVYTTTSGVESVDIAAFEGKLEEVAQSCSRRGTSARRTPRSRPSVRIARRSCRNSIVCCCRMPPPSECTTCRSS